MPIYEYHCAACGHDVEVLQKMADAPLRKCPDCGKARLQRLVSAPRFRLKGSGWYETDFKGKDETKRNLVGADAEAPSDAAGDSATKDETKPKGDAGKEPAAPKSDGAEKGKDKPVAKSKPVKKAPVKAKAGKSARA